MPELRCDCLAPANEATIGREISLGVYNHTRVTVYWQCTNHHDNMTWWRPHLGLWAQRRESRAEDYAGLNFVPVDFAHV